MYTFQLLNYPGNYKRGTMPYGPRAYVALKTSTKKLWQDKSGKKKYFTCISPECVSYGEFQYSVDMLIKELEKIKKQGKSFFEKEQKRRAERSKR